jgi:hypothetical protein
MHGPDARQGCQRRKVYTTLMPGRLAGYASRGAWCLEPPHCDVVVVVASPVRGLGSNVWLPNRDQVSYSASLVGPKAGLPAPAARSLLASSRLPSGRSQLWRSMACANILLCSLVARKLVRSFVSITDHWECSIANNSTISTDKIAITCHSLCTAECLLNTPTAGGICTVFVVGP